MDDARERQRKRKAPNPHKTPKKTKKPTPQNSKRSDDYPFSAEAKGKYKKVKKTGGVGGLVNYRRFKSALGKR